MLLTRFPGRTVVRKGPGQKIRELSARINVDKARSFSGMSISFDFPVTAIVGPNGGGKTSLAGKNPKRGPLLRIPLRRRGERKSLPR
ncbi:MAG: ATP-binding protein [Achromobacter sp.]|uniref:ATP-binding protein n=1 Tax=Achromobacter sp. TaxID=134375 RepID=UPI003D07E229